MYNVVNTLAPSFLIGSSSLLQVTRTKAQWLEPRPSDLAVVGLSPGWGGYMCLPYLGLEPPGN